MSELAFIVLGSNRDGETFLPLAIDRLSKLGRVLGASMVYQSRAVGAIDQPDFLNAAAMISTDLTWASLRQGLRGIEKDLGRVRGADKNTARLIDLDLCLYGQTRVADDVAVIPHPDTVDQAYVAIPLAELDPLFIHPTTGETLEAIAARLRAACDLLPRPDVVLPFARHSSK